MENNKEDIIDLLRNSKSDTVCPFCSSEQIIKFGKVRERKRFRCKECGRTFLETSNTAFDGTHKTMSTWKIFVESLLSGDSVKESASKCGISVKTSFVWRHKLLDALSVYAQKQEAIGGDVDLGTMFFKENYKGCRKPIRPHSPFFIGVSVAANSRGKTRSVISSINAMSDKDVAALMNDKVQDNIAAVTSEKIIFAELARKKSLKLRRLPKQTVYINKYDDNMREFIQRKRGFASKYLENYLLLFDIAKEMSVDEIMKNIYTISFSEKFKEVGQRPLIPKIRRSAQPTSNDSISDK